eukprot:175890_1
MYEVLMILVQVIGIGLSVKIPTVTNEGFGTIEFEWPDACVANHENSPYEPTEEIKNGDVISFDAKGKGTTTTSFELQFNGKFKKSVTGMDDVDDVEIKDVNKQVAKAFNGGLKITLTHFPSKVGRGKKVAWTKTITDVKSHTVKKKAKFEWCTKPLSRLKTVLTKDTATKS